MRTIMSIHSDDFPRYPHTDKLKESSLYPATIGNLKALLAAKFRILEKDNCFELHIHGTGVVITRSDFPDLTNKNDPIYLCLRSLCAQYFLPYEVLDFLALSDVVNPEFPLINFDDYTVNYDEVNHG